MDDNELDRLFGYDGGQDGSGADDPEHLQIVDSKEKKDGSVKKESPDKEPSQKDSAKEEKESEDKKPEDKEEKPESPEGEKEASEEGSSGGDNEKSGQEEEEKKPEEEKDGKEGEETDKAEKSEDKEHKISAKKPSGEHAKEAKKAPKKPRRRLSAFGISVITFAIMLIVLIVLFLFLPAFRVRSVTIEGNVEMTDEEVLKEVGLKYNAHLMSGVSGNILDILSFNYGKTEERIRRENPYISDITISIRIPSEVRISIKERRKIAYVSTPDGYIALDRYGTVLELDSGKVKQKVSPIVYGISVESAKLGEKVVVREENAYKQAIVVLGAILSADNATIGDDFNMFEHTTEVRVLPSGYIFLTIYTESGKPVQIKLNKTDKINDKMSKLLYLFNSKAFDQVTTRGTLDMTGDEFIFNSSN